MKFSQKGEGSNFSHKKRGFGKIAGVGRLSLIFMLTNSLQYHLSECLMCVNVLRIYTITISIVCVSWEELTLTESNQ